jgi:hypothetical protein
MKRPRAVPRPCLQPPRPELPDTGADLAQQSLSHAAPPVVGINRDHTPGTPGILTPPPPRGNETTAPPA